MDYPISGGNLWKIPELKNSIQTKLALLLEKVFTPLYTVVKHKENMLQSEIVNEKPNPPAMLGRME